jgi:hypothetical protein
MVGPMKSETSETSLHDESDYAEQDNKNSVDEQNFQAELEDPLDAPDGILLHESLHASPCEYDVFNEESLSEVNQELKSLCLDLEINPELVIPLWNIWIAGQFEMDIIGSFTHPSPIEVWERICSCSVAFAPNSPSLLYEHEALPRIGQAPSSDLF